MGLLCWVQYNDNASGGAVAVGCSLGVLLWVQYHFNTSGGVIAAVAVRVLYFGCSTILILVVAL